jgi:thymidylate synthase
MNERYTFATASEALPFICSRILDKGDEVGSRNGRVKEFLNTQIVLTDPQRREITTANRHANVFAQIAETMWVLSGRNDIEWLSAYLPRAKDYSDDGRVWRGGYGPRIRHYDKHWQGVAHGDSNHIDQLAHVVNLLREDPLSRRAVIAIYDPGADTKPGKDIPCNDFLQFQSRLGALHLTVTVRSNDLMWGWSGINAFEWSTLQEIVASMLGITVGTLTFNIGSLHLYDQHWNKAAHLRFDDYGYAITPFDPDRNVKSMRDLNNLLETWFDWEELCRKGEATRIALEVIEEPLIKSWAAAIAYYWQRDEHWLEIIGRTALAVAIARTPASLLPEPRAASRSSAAAVGHNMQSHERSRAFYGFVTDLHAKKHASYGDSWKKRGEKMSILANMARKVDRLGIGDEFDSSADTIVDLLVYTIKYECWLNGMPGDPPEVDARLADYLQETEQTVGQAVDITIADVVTEFNGYCDDIDGFSEEEKRAFVRALALNLTPVARDVWYEETNNTDQYEGADAD